MNTIKMGKRGTIVLPSVIRKQFGLEDGSLLITETKNGEIRLRPALLYTPEVWSKEETAYFMLINCITQEEWDAMIPDVVAMGIDPAQIEGIEPNHRDTLPSELSLREQDAKILQAKTLHQNHSKRLIA